MSERAQRLAARRKAKAALGPLRALVKTLTIWERLEEADAFGVVQIFPGDSEADYASDVLNMVGLAVQEAGQSTVEIFVVSTPSIHSAQRIGESCPEQVSIPQNAQRPANQIPSSSAKRSTSPRG